MTAVSATSTEQRSERWITLKAAGQFVHRQILPIQNGWLKDRPDAVAALARLRRGLGKPVGTVAEILQYTVDDSLAPRDGSDAPSHSEIAVHLALTLYAAHQQSRPSGMHKRGPSLGTALRRLHPEEFDGPNDPVLRRFLVLGTSDTLEELAHHSRGVVQLLRDNDQPLDYGLLADHLVRWQQPGGPAAVRLVWGRDFYRAPPKKKGADTDAPAQNADNK